MGWMDFRWKFGLFLFLFLIFQLSESRRSNDRGDSLAREQLKTIPKSTTTKKPGLLDRIKDKIKPSKTTTTKRPPSTTTEETRKFVGKSRGDSDARKALLTTTTITTQKPYGWAVERGTTTRRPMTTTRRPVTTPYWMRDHWRDSNGRMTTTTTTTTIRPRDFKPDFRSLPYRPTAFGSGFKNPYGGDWGWSSSNPRPSVSQFSVVRGLFSQPSFKNTHSGYGRPYGVREQYSVYNHYPRSHVEERRKMIASQNQGRSNEEATNSTKVDTTSQLLLGGDLFYNGTEWEEGNGTDVRVIAHPSRPVVIQDIAFFWDAHFLPDKNDLGCLNYTAANSNATIQYCRPYSLTRCTRDLKELPSHQSDSLFFPNGTAPSHLAWLCPPDRSCCGWECCEKKEEKQTSEGGTRRNKGDYGHVIFWLIILALVLLLCGYVCFKCYNKAKMEWEDRKYQRECREMEMAKYQREAQQLLKNSQ